MTVEDPWSVAAPDSDATHVSVRLAGGHYAVPLAAVTGVAAVPAVTRVPGSPVWLAGAANWRGRLLAVLDLRPLLGVERHALASSARLVVVEHGEVRAGLLVEAVTGLVEGDPELHPVPATASPAAASILIGTFAEGPPTAVLDPEAVLALRGQLPQARAAS
jgi:chemotaxis signal transduction protein